MRQGMHAIEWEKQSKCPGLMTRNLITITRIHSLCINVQAVYPQEKDTQSNCDNGLLNGIMKHQHQL